MPVAELFANEISASLAVPLNPGDISFTVTGGSGFPAASTGVAQFRARIRKAAADPANTHEYVLVSNIAGSVWTVTRGIEGSSALAWVAGSVIEPVFTAAVAGSLAQKSMANVDPNDVKALLGLGSAAFVPSSAFDVAGAATAAQSAAAADATSKVAGEATARASAITAAIATEITNRNAAVASSIATEVTARNTAISAEATARNSAIASAVATAQTAAATDATNKVAAEAVSRAAAIAQEVTDRNAAVAAEATARDTAISAAGATEVTARDAAIGTAVAAEATARDSAISTAVAAEATARGSAITSAVAAEATARGTAITSAVSGEATARDAAISAAIATEVTNRNAAVATETTARTAAVSAEATARASAISAAIAQEVTDRNAAISSAVSGGAVSADLVSFNPTTTAGYAAENSLLPEGAPILSFIAGTNLQDALEDEHRWAYASMIQWYGLALRDSKRLVMALVGSAPTTVEGEVIPGIAGLTAPGGLLVGRKIIESSLAAGTPSVGMAPLYTANGEAVWGAPTAVVTRAWAAQYSDHGMLTESYGGPAIMAAGTSTLLAASTCYLIRVPVTAGVTYTTIVVSTSAAGVTLAANLYAFSLHNCDATGTLIAGSGTADAASFWSTAGTRTINLGAAYTPGATGYILIAVQTGTAATQPKVFSVNHTLLNVNLANGTNVAPNAANCPLWGTATTGFTGLTPPSAVGNMIEGGSTIPFYIGLK